MIGDVISEPPAGSNFYPTIEIDRGTADGVGVGMPVVAGAGLVGEVLDAGRTTSVIRLITDARSQVGVRFADGTIRDRNGSGDGRSPHSRAGDGERSPAQEGSAPRD